MKPRSLMLAIGLALPLTTAAQIPNTDWAQLAQSILSNMESLQAAAEQVAGAKKQLEQAGVMTEAKVDGWNNASANAIGRINQQKTDVHNMEIARDARPVREACAPVSVSAELDQAVCDIIDSVTKQAARTDQATLASAPGLRAALTGQPAGEWVPPVTSSVKDLTPDRIGALSGQPVSHNQATAETTQRMLDVTFPAYQGDNARSHLSDKQVAVELREALRTNLPRKMAGSVAARRQEQETSSFSSTLGASMGPTSEAGLVTAFGKAWFDPERVASLTTGKTQTESSLWRDRSVSRAFLVWRSVNEYELALEREVALATQLLESLEK